MVFYKLHGYRIVLIHVSNYYTYIHYSHVVEIFTSKFYNKTSFYVFLLALDIMNITQDAINSHFLLPIIIISKKLLLN